MATDLRSFSGAKPSCPCTTVSILRPWWSLLPPTHDDFASCIMHPCISSRKSSNDRHWKTAFLFWCEDDSLFDFGYVVIGDASVMDNGIGLVWTYGLDVGCWMLIEYGLSMSMSMSVSVWQWVWLWVLFFSSSFFFSSFTPMGLTGYLFVSFFLNRSQPLRSCFCLLNLLFSSFLFSSLLFPCFFSLTCGSELETEMKVSSEHREWKSRVVDGGIH